MSKLYLILQLSLDWQYHFITERLWTSTTSTHHPGYLVLPTHFKRFECLQCHRRFTQKTTITDHLRYFCGKGKQFKCPYCETLGGNSSNIYQHIRRHHKNMQPGVIKLFSKIRATTSTNWIVQKEKFCFWFGSNFKLLFVELVYFINAIDK